MYLVRELPCILSHIIQEHLLFFKHRLNFRAQTWYLHVCVKIYTLFAGWEIRYIVNQNGGPVDFKMYICFQNAVVVRMRTFHLQGNQYGSYSLKLINFCSHFLTVNCRYWHCYMYIKLYHCVRWRSLRWPRGKFGKIVSKCFLQVFKGFKLYVF